MLVGTVLIGLLISDAAILLAAYFLDCQQGRPTSKVRSAPWLRADLPRAHAGRVVMPLSTVAVARLRLKRTGHGTKPLRRAWAIAHPAPRVTNRSAII